MRRRITIAFVAILAVSLFLAGSISLYLVHRAAGENARSQLLLQANAIERSLNNREVKNNPGFYTIVFSLTPFLTADHVEGTIEITATSSRVISVTSLPGVPTSNIDAKSLIQGKAVAGLVGSLAYAVGPLFSVQLHGRTDMVAFALEHPVSFAGENTWYFLVAGGVSLLVAGALAAAISRRVAGHVVTAANVAEQIASGDLATRIDLSGREYPELSQLGQSLNTMAAALERSRELDRQFLLSISHDLRTPLTSIRGYAEAIAEGVTDNLEAAAGVLVSESDRLGRLINDLLELARIDARQFSLHLEPFDVTLAVIAATDALRYEFEQNGIALSLDIEKGPLLIEGDRDRLSQIISNLIENALKFTQSVVVVRVLPVDGVTIEVEDDGNGISQEDLPHVFDRHFTSGRGKSRSTGTGLGLAIVTELVNAMSGSITADSPVFAGRGTKISVQFPQAPAESALDL